MCVCVCVWRGCVLACVRVCVLFPLFLCGFSRALCAYVYDFLLFFLSRSRALFTSMCFPLFFFWRARARCCMYYSPFFLRTRVPCVCVFLFLRTRCVRACVRARARVYLCVWFGVYVCIFSFFFVPCG